MVEEKFTFLSKDGKTTVDAVKWMPDDGKYEGILQIVHGMVEHIWRYRDFAQYLTEQGFLVVGHTHIGHGESVTTQEDWGYFAPDTPSDILIEDIHQLREQVQKEYPDMPYFILGHSMGSYLLRKYLCIYHDNLRGAIIMGTGYVPEGLTKFGMTLCRFLAKLHGWHYRSRLVQGLSYTKPYKQYDLTGKDLSNSWLTKDEAIVKAYYEDPACTYLFTLNGYMGLFEAVLYSNQTENIAKMSKKLPLFLVSGEGDPVGDCGKGVRKVETLMEEAGIKDLTCKLYENDRHEILNETNRQQVYADIYAWMKVRIYT